MLLLLSIFIKIRYIYIINTIIVRGVGKVFKNYFKLFMNENNIIIR